MKIKIVLNNCNWLSIEQKIQSIKNFYDPFPLEIDCVHTFFARIPFITVPSTDGSSGQEKTGTTEIVEKVWYDQHVTELALDYDMVLFYVPNSDKKGHVTSAGIRGDRNLGPVELTVFGGNEDDHTYNQGVDMGNNFVFFCCHEIAHGISMIQGGVDNTHKYFYTTTPRDFLKEIKMPNTADKITLINTLLYYCYQLLGLYKIKQAMNSIPTISLLDKMCMAIQKHEGWYEGSRSYRNNNPGNLKYIGQQTAIGKDKSGFAVFKSYKDGYDTLKTMILNCARGFSKVYKPEMTLTQFFLLYAPTFDNNDSDAYAKAVANDMGVSTSFQIRDLVE